MMMKIGNTTIHIVSDGSIKNDGGSLFGAVPKTDWEQFKRPDRRNLARADHGRLILQFRGGQSAEDRD